MDGKDVIHKILDLEPKDLILCHVRVRADLQDRFLASMKEAGVEGPNFFHASLEFVSGLATEVEVDACLPCDLIYEESETPLDDRVKATLGGVLFDGKSYMDDTVVPPVLTEAQTEQLKVRTLFEAALSLLGDPIKARKLVVTILQAPKV